MSPLLSFYRDQAAQQQMAADAAILENVRDRCQRASHAWAALAIRSERADSGRARAVADRLPEELDKDSRGTMTVELREGRA